MKHLLLIITALLSVNLYAQTSTPAGKTIMVRGSVLASGVDPEQQRPLKRRDTVFNVDHITTGNASKAQFSMTDGGLIALKENSELSIGNYQFDELTQQGSASIELLKGGLRSISGVIKKNGGSYNIKTPVGSIGIRGTHFEIQLVDNDVFLAVWDGAIDLTMTNQNVISLGGNEDFSFAQVTAAGEVLMTSEAADVFAQKVAAIDGESNENGQQPQQEAAASFAPTLGSEETTIASSFEQIDTIVTDVYSEQTFQTTTDMSLVDQIAERQGVFQYQASNYSIDSSVGAVEDFLMTMEINFDNGTVPNGEISFNDTEGTWYAAYSGLINVSNLDLAITFASHGNNLATGEIDAAFFNDLDNISGSFDITEINNPNVNASGAFSLEP